MIKQEIFKAQGIGKGETESLTLIFKAPFPDWKDRSLEEVDRIHDGEASALEALLYRTLSGGTYDRLAGYMLRRLSSHFVVSHVIPSVEAK